MRIYLADTDAHRLRHATPDSVLVSYYYYKDLDFDNFVSGIGEDTNIFSDSGAYSSESKGVPIEIEDYIEWIRKYENCFSVYSNLDVIYNQIKTRENQKIMEDAGLSPLPVFHVGSSISELETLCSNYNYIAIGGMVPYMKSPNKIMKSLHRYHEVAKGIKLHGFGCTNWTLLVKFPWFSVDSSSWLSSVRFGEVPFFDIRTGKFFRIKKEDWPTWRKYRKDISRLGFDWRQLASVQTGATEENLIRFSVATYKMVEDYLNGLR